jgi:hypothetical protein
VILDQAAEVMVDMLNINAPGAKPAKPRPVTARREAV